MPSSGVFVVGIIDHSPDTEEKLIARARRGDAHAFGDLVTIHSALAFRAAFVITGSAADAEDAAQDAFVKAFRSLPGFDLSRTFRPWLLSIVANEARNKVRGRTRRAAAELRASSADLAISEESTEAQVMASQDRIHLLNALNRCAAEDRLVIACRYLLDLSVDETAATLVSPWEP